jgi:hypothetical protein
MQLKSISLIALCLLGLTDLRAQELYMPRNIKNAYQAGTRAMDGRPAKGYWQNRGKYDMTIKVTPQTRMVDGQETIVYTNNSKDTLKRVMIRFVNNVHKTEAPRASYSSKDFLTSGLVINNFAVDGETIRVDGKSWGTVASVPLKKPLLPGQSATFAIGWSYPLSKESGREGQIDSTTFFVAYAYPRISVYDDADGWDWLPHLGRNEFYNDFNDYKFAVKVPKNYVVWGTGDLLNPTEVLQPAYAARLTHSYASNEITNIASAEEMKKGQVTKQQEWNTWKFAVNNITDVTFGLSNHYVWDAGSVIVDKKTARRASVQAAYDAKAKDFPHAAKWTQQALDFFSNQMPAVPYPYSKMTAFQGYADMEFPMMVNDTSTPDLQFSQFVLNHEVAHTYFPFYMGTNETNYPFMDEGWVTTMEYFINTHQFGKAAADSLYKAFRVKRWILDPSAEQDQPIISLGTQVSGSGYGNNAYVKPSLAYLGLRDLLGEAQFMKALHEYMERWNGKHPLPWDFFNSFNDALKQDLNWYWNNWFFSNNYIDLAIDKVSIKGNSYNINLKNVGGFAVPFDVILRFEDGKQTVVHKTPAIWKDNMKAASFSVNGAANLKSISIEGGLFMDATPEDNTWKK